jgi:hypothetical protein
MIVNSVDVLSKRLKPLCCRDNHVMKYESANSKANTGTEPRTIAASRVAAFDTAQPTDITCLLECLTTRTPSTSLA